MPAAFVPPTGGFALTVVDASLKKAGIYAGDTLVIMETDSVKNGMLGIGTVLRRRIVVERMYKHGNGVELRSPIDTDPPRTVQSGDLEVLGEVTGLLRRYE